MAVNTGKRLGELNESHVDSQGKIPSVIAGAKQALLALVVSAGLAGNAMAEENKPTEEVQVADASGQIVLANYQETGGLSQDDIIAGIDELTQGFISDGETPEDARNYAQETIGAFLNGKNDGGAEYIAQFAPNLTKKILTHPGKFKLAIVLDTEATRQDTEAIRQDTEATRQDTEATRENIARLKKLGGNIDDVTTQSTN